MSAADNQRPSVKQLAIAAQMMPWDKSITDVPFDARYAFSKAITADHYLEVLEALEALLNDVGGANSMLGAVKARAAIAKATSQS